MDYKEAIMARISRRSYLGSEISPQHLKAFNEKIAELNTQSGLAISFVAEGAAAFARGKSYGMFDGVRALLLLKGDSTLPHLREKIGYYGEELVLAATELGLGTCWVGGTFDKKALQVPDGEELVCVVTIGNVSEQNTLKERLIRGLTHRKTKTIEELIDSDLPLTEELRSTMELVQRAPTALNAQKVRFCLQSGEITASVPGKYPFDLVDLGICKRHFVCGMGGSFAWGNHAKLTR